MTEDRTRAELRRNARPYLLTSCTIVVIEGLTFLLLGVLALADAGSTNIASDAGIALFLGVYGAAQLYACRQLLTWHSGARSPLVFTQLILLGLAWGLRDSDQPEVAVLMTVGAIIALIGLLAPGVTRALTADQVI